MIMTGITIIRTGCQAPWKEALRKAAITTLAAALVFIISATAVNAASRIKDIVDFEGVRDNMLVGYGLVVGLNNTGDTLATGHFTKESLQSMLNRLGVQTTDTGLSSKNVAAVMVTASLPPFSQTRMKCVPTTAMSAWPRKAAAARTAAAWLLTSKATARRGA